MLFAFGLTARGELTASALASDWRVWQLREQGTNGIGVSQTYAADQPAAEACRRTRVWLIVWRPALRIETAEYDDCEARGESPLLATPLLATPLLATPHRSAIIMARLPPQPKS